CREAHRDRRRGVADVSHTAATARAREARSSTEARARHRRLLTIELGTAVVATAFVVLAVLAHHEAYFAVDLAMTRAIQGIHGAWFVAPLAVLSALGF